MPLEDHRNHGRSYWANQRRNQGLLPAAECRRASEFIETALGQRTGERLTGEFYAQENQPQQLKEGT